MEEISELKREGLSIQAISQALSIDKAFQQARAEFLVLIRNQMRLLLETKHLYQRVSIDSKEIFESIKSKMANRDNLLFHDETNRNLIPRPLKLVNEDEYHHDIGDSLKRGRDTGFITTYLIMGNIKLFCSQCGAREVFSPLWYHDFYEEQVAASLIPAIAAGGQPLSDKPAKQLLFVVYQCQLCRGHPTSFIVRRDGRSLSLDGRSPIEEIEVPSFLPKKEVNFFHDALIGFHAGKPLAALFYLRTFIEQFSRGQTGKLHERATGDEILEAYADLPPEKQRELMPSLKHWYDKLSEALHAAQSDEAVFENARNEIVRHFDIRRMFNIPDAAVRREPESGP